MRALSDGTLKLILPHFGGVRSALPKRLSEIYEEVYQLVHERGAGKAFISFQRNEFC